MRPKQVLINDEVYAILVPKEEVKEGSEWFGSQIESIQASRMKYKAGKSFRIHHHILNPRTIKRTQECFIVIEGKIAVDIYNNEAQFVGTLEGHPGEAVIVYRGGHGVRVVEDCVVYEVKAGSFSLVSEDKEFRNG